MTWPNLLRILSTIALVVMGVAHFGFNALANPIPMEVIYGLVAVALGVDAKALRGVILKLLGGGK